MAKLENYCFVVPGEAEKHFDENGQPRDWSDPVIKGLDWDLEYKEFDAWLDEKIAFMAEREPGSSLVGCVVRFGVADGYAWYLVTKDKPLTLQFVYGEYQEQEYAIRGLQKDDVERIVGSLTFFAKKKVQS